MKKIICFLFIIFAVPAGNIHAQKVVGFLIPVSGLGDNSFNDMTYAGLIQSKNKYNFKLIREKAAGQGAQGRRHAMERLLARGADFIVTNGWEYTDTIRDYAPQYPDRYFLLHDAPVHGIDNVASTVFDQHEGSFLAGALAAWTSVSGRIGFIGGKDMPVIQAFLTGYEEGARHAREDISITSIFLSSKEEPTAGFDNPGLAFQRANSLYDDNIDIIFAVAGLAGNGIIRAAALNDAYAIGVDADQDHMAKGHVLTSVMKRLDTATIQILRLYFEGKFSSGVHTFGLKEQGVALSPMTYTRSMLPPERLEKLERLKEDIIAGRIRVTNYLDETTAP